MEYFTRLGMEFLQVSHSPFRIFANIVLAGILAWIIIKIYLRHYRGYGQPFQMCLSLMICSVVTCAIIMIIGSNIALSLGLVGALSIIRFRTPIKDSRDLAYLFWAICIGLGSGAGAYVVIGVLTVLLAVILFYLEGNPGWATRFADYLIVVSVDNEQGKNLDLLEHLPKGSRLKSVTSLDEVSEFTFSLRDIDGGATSVVAALEDVPGVVQTHVVSPDYEVLGKCRLNSILPSHSLSKAWLSHLL